MFYNVAKHENQSVGAENFSQTNLPKGKIHIRPVESNKYEANKVKPCLGVQHKQIGEFPLFQNVSFSGI